jgi:hypothetical protein
MATDDPNFDQLSSLLQECLGRIESETSSLAEESEETLDYGEIDRLDGATSDLQHLIDALVVVDAGNEDAEVNQIVERAAEDSLQDIGVPVVQRMQLCCESTGVAAPRDLVTVAIQRALNLATSQLGPGDELNLTTRVEHRSVIFEVESRGSKRDQSTQYRSETLRDFVRGFGGGCMVHMEQDDMFLVLELPQVLAQDPSDPS